VQKGTMLSGGGTPLGLGGHASTISRGAGPENLSTIRSLAAVGTRDAGQSPVLDPPSSTLIADFARLAETLDSAGLGPADYLYSSLKWRLQRPGINQYPLPRSLLKTLWQVLTNPPMVPRRVAHASILAASSYVVSANLLRQVIADLEAGEGILFDASDVASRPRIARLVDALNLLLALPRALIFTVRVRSTLMRVGAGSVERNRIALAGFVNGIHRSAARAILKKVRPKCLVIGNGNRPLELSLWAEARAQGIATVLLPYAEINLKPARFLSLCRGNFDLVLPFSDYSASQMRKLKPNVQFEVVGFPVGFASADVDDSVFDKTEPRRNVLYVAGNNFETAAAKLIREAFGHSTDLRLRVRPHPRNWQHKGSAPSELFGWLDQTGISDPDRVELSEDIALSDVVITIRSTAAIDAMMAGVPLVWLSPPPYRKELEHAPLRMQRLGSLEATTSTELRTIINKLLDDESERKRVVEEQWFHLRAAGYDRNYFTNVRSALRQLVGRCQLVKSNDKSPGFGLRETP
jgi:hypothetical protein